MFARMQFPNTVSEKALLAFAEYMYDGILNKDPDILIQMKIIAQRLDMKVFQKICNNQLQLVLPQNIPSPPISLMLSEPCSSSGLIDDDIPSDDIDIHPEQKNTLVVPNHQQAVMSNISWIKDAGRLCDAFIGNGTQSVKVSVFPKIESSDDGVCCVSSALIDIRVLLRLVM